MKEMMTTFVQDYDGNLRPASKKTLNKTNQRSKSGIGSITTKDEKAEVKPRKKSKRKVDEEDSPSKI